MSFNHRTLQYSIAINEALHQMMSADESVFLMGQGVKSPWYVGNTTKGLLERFGPDRVIDTPVSENAITGAGVGAALVGMRPVVVHPRMDFMLYAMDSIVNQAANWHYMFGGRSAVPIVIWGIINRGGEQGAQHSQALQALFAHIPGLKVVAPSTPYDAKGLMIASIKDENPVIYVDDRWLYDMEGKVPETVYSVRIGKGKVRRRGKDLTILSSSYMAIECIKAAEMLESDGIEAEVIDLRSVKPVDESIIIESVERTGRLLVVDGGWKTCGVAAEIAAMAAEKAFDALKSGINRLTLPDVPAPASSALERVYYPNCNDIIQNARQLVFGKESMRCIKSAL